MRDGSWRTNPPGLLVRACLILPALAAVLISLYLLRSSLSLRPVAGCNGTSAFGCDHVLNSPWSTWFGVPVSMGSVFVYTAILASSFAIGPGTVRQHQRIAWIILFPCAILAGGAAVWFTILQMGADVGFCSYCLTVHGCGLIIAVLTALCVPVGLDRRSLLTRPITAWSGAGAGAVLAMLIFGQLLTPTNADIENITAHAEAPVEPGTETFETTSDAAVYPRPGTETAFIDAATPVTNDAQSDDGQTNDEPLQRVIGLSHNRLVIDAYNEPVIGDPDAATIIACHFDYTCPHCRRDLMPTLKQIPERYGGEVAVILIPTPLNGGCNTYIKRTQRIHQYACRYARYALVVWHVDRTKFADYHTWLFETEEPPPPDEAKARAKVLVGEDKFNKAIRDPWVIGMIKRNTQFFHRSPGPTMPKLVSKEYTESRPPHLIFKFIQRKLRIRPAPRVSG